MEARSRAKSRRRGPIIRTTHIDPSTVDIAQLLCDSDYLETERETEARSLHHGYIKAKAQREIMKIIKSKSKSVKQIFLFTFYCSSVKAVGLMVGGKLGTGKQLHFNWHRRRLSNCLLSSIREWKSLLSRDTCVNTLEFWLGSAFTCLVLLMATTSCSFSASTGEARLAWGRKPPHCCSMCAVQSVGPHPGWTPPNRSVWW